MKKGYDSLFDYTYDYDISLYDNDKKREFDVNSHNFTVLYAEFLSKQYLIRQSLYKEKKKSAKFKYVSVKDYFHIKEEAEEIAFESVSNAIIKLAKSGYPKAVALYLKTHKIIDRDPEIVEIAKNFEKLELKTPEQFEAVAALHIYDTVSLNGKDITIKEAGHDSLMAYFIQNSDKKKKDYETINDGSKSAIYRKIVENSAFGEAMAKAQLGYYIRILDNNYISDVGNYINVNADISAALVPSDVLREYSNGKVLTNKNFKNLMIRYIGRFPPKNSSIEDCFAYGLAYLLSSGSTLEKRRGLKMLIGVANSPIFVREATTEKNMKPVITKEDL